MDSLLIAKLILGAAPFLYTHARATEDVLPSKIAKQLPSGYRVIAHAMSDFNGDKLMDHIVVLQAENEEQIYRNTGTALRRPLIIFLQGAKSEFTLAARNDSVVFTVDEGDQCDPFLDGGQGVAAKGPYFTVENAIACGAHWSDYITFRYSERLKNFVFHKRVYESWTLANVQGASGALVRTGRRVVVSNPQTPVLIKEYRAPTVR